MADVTLDKRVLERIIAQTPQKLSAFLDSEAQTIVNNIKLSFGTSPPGRVYKKRATYHIASQPRFPPNVDTGLLRARIRWSRQGRFTRLIMDGVNYGVHLELGTSKMAPRPFMIPELMKAHTRLVDDMRRAGLFQ